MILGEGAVFGLSLLLGIYLIYRAYLKEINTSRNQNNFLLSVSHELKSPLTSINLSLETLIKRNLDHHTVRDLSETAHKESKRLEKLINSILYAAKIDHNFVLSKHKIDLSELISEIISVFETTHHEVIIQFETNGPSFVFADINALQSVFINLIDNAIKYGNGSRVNIVLYEHSDRVHVDIADQGIGIPTEEKNKIFNKFYRVGDETVRKSKGTGLGLYIVKKIVEAHGGKIEVTSNLPSGSKFSIIFKKDH